MGNISDWEELRQLIAKYVRGKASSDEILFLKKYYDHFDDQKDGIEILDSDERAQLKSQIYHEIQFKIESNQKGRSSFIWIYRMAAAVIAMIVVVGVFWKSNPVSLKMDQTVVQVPLNSFVTDTAFSEDKHIYLSDGSYVILRPGSQLKYFFEFGNNIREVVLDGEAYFDIQHDSLRPFLVKTDVVTTRVLGTAFTISSFDQNVEFSISVTRGRVEVADQIHQLGFLQKDDQLILDKVTQEVTKIKLNEEETADIEPTEFTMNNMSVAEAISIIGKRWKCEFIIENPALKNCRFTTSFTPTDSLEEIITVIAKVVGANYGIENNIVSLSGKGCT